MKAQTTEKIDDYTLAIAIGTLLLANELRSVEKEKERQKKKSKVIERKLKLLREAFPEYAANIHDAGFQAYQLLKDFCPKEKEKAVTFVIDLAFSNPFAPYELKFNEGDFKKALKTVAGWVGVDADTVDCILNTKKDALKAHRNINWAKIAIYSISGLLVIGAGGWVAAPAIGSAIGASAGLSGAAATAHGLAILGGGSLALGGAGMAGGMWLVVGAGATIGLTIGGGSTLLLQLGAATAKIELAKLQVNFKIMVLDSQIQLKKAQEIIKNLKQSHDEVKERVKEERELNEKNSQRLKDMEETLEAVENAIKWMEKGKH